MLRGIYVSNVMIYNLCFEVCNRPGMLTISSDKKVITDIKLFRPTDNGGYLAFSVCYAAAAVWRFWR